MVALDFLQLISQVVKSPVVEPAHEGSKNATDDLKRMVPSNPVVIR